MTLRIYKNISEMVVSLQPFYKHLTICHLLDYRKAIKNEGLRYLLNYYLSSRANAFKIITMLSDEGEDDGIH